MFLFKKIVAPFFFPIPFCVELLLVGLILLWFTKRQSLGKILVTTAFLFLLMVGYPKVPDWMLGRIEWQYHPFTNSQSRDYKWIVILGGGHSADPRLPETDRLSTSSILRVVEGIRLWRMFPNAKIVLSGGRTFGQQYTEAEVMSAAAISLGVPREAMVLEDRARDTQEESEFMKPIVKADPFLLVTSASHMPRSMGLFLKQGLHPVPAPADYQVKKNSDRLTPFSFFPFSGSISKAENATYETLGLVWESLNGRM